MSCKHCPHCEEEEQRTAPKVWRSDSDKSGSCNFCNRYVGPTGLTRKHDITCIQSPSPNGLVVRICDLCLRQLATESGLPDFIKGW